MKIITDPRCTDYQAPGHPERPQRISRTVERLKEQKSLLVEWLAPLPLEEDVLLRAHSQDHLRRLSQSEAFDGDTPAYPHIAEHARGSAGAALAAMKLAFKGETNFSLIRPPGHHATRDRAMGFCYLNSMAIAVLAAQAAGSEKVAVFDFDVHHGNGTEAILLGRKGCLYTSVHQFPAYPGTGKASVKNSFNFPVAPESPAEKYRAACHGALDEIKKFKPALLGVSAGFDAYKGDPLCQQKMDVADYFWLGKTVRELGLPTFSILEGGYSDQLPLLIEAYLCGLEGVEVPAQS